MSLRASKFEHINGTAPSSAAVPAQEKINIRRGLGKKLIIQNVDAANTLQVSFDGGQNYFSIPPGTAETPYRPLIIDVLFHYIVVRGEGATADYEILLGVN